MASAYAIAAVGKAILTLLAAQVPADLSPATFKLTNARDFQEPVTEGITLYLHRVVPATVRNVPPRVRLDGRRFRPSFPVELHYLLIPWARDAYKQQLYLGWAIRAIEDTPVLYASFLNENAPEPDTFAENESLDVLMETLSIQDIGAIWEVNKPNIQPAVPYVVRMLSLDSAIEMAEVERVQTRVFDAGKVVP